MSFLFFIITLPAYCLFLLRKNKTKEISEDFEAWISRHHLESLSTYAAFIRLMHFKEYRTALYYRLPLVGRHICNTILNGCGLKINTLYMGGGIIIEHGWGSIILAESVGSNFTIFQNCTVGWNHGGKPTIGNNVTMYPGSVVAGPIKVGHNVTIGANCVVLVDIPDNSLCYGNPCVIKSKK